MYNGDYNKKDRRIAVPNYYFKEIWTPLALIGIKFFKDDENRTWIKVWTKQRRLLNNKV